MARSGFIHEKVKQKTSNLYQPLKFKKKKLVWNLNYCSLFLKRKKIAKKSIKKSDLNLSIKLDMEGHLEKKHF